MSRRALPLLPLVLLSACTDRAPLTPNASAPLETPAPASATVAATMASVQVNSTADPGDGVCDTAECTLREAIAAVATGGEITFVPGLSGVIALSAASGQLQIDRGVTLVGPGAGALTVRGNRETRQATRLLLVRSGGAEVRISGLTFEKGYVDGPGGCIQSEGSSLTLSRVVVRHCEGWGAGGGVGSTGRAGVVGSLTLGEVAVRDNWAADGGGGVYNDHSSVLVVHRSTVSGNEGREGGGIGSTGQATIVNSTVSGNVARAQGGGIYHQNQFMTVAHSTIAHNTAAQGGGAYFYGDWGALALTHTIVARNESASGPDCTASAGRLPVTSNGYNLIGDPSGCAWTGPQPGDIVGVDPVLGGLAANGGPTATHALLAGSPALNAGSPTFAPPPATDQRGTGYPRVQSGRVDIGAYEAFFFSFTGFLAPITNLPGVNSVRAGQSVPVRFSLDGDQGLAIFAPGYPKSEAVACSGSIESSTVASTATAGHSQLSYDAANGTYTYVWKTERSWAGTCRLLVVQLTDGTVHSAEFRFN